MIVDKQIYIITSTNNWYFQQCLAIFQHESRKDLNSEAAGRDVAHECRDIKDEFVQK